MRLEWTEQALECFRNIRSQHYTQFETAQYKNACSEVFQYKKRVEKVVIKSSLINLLSITHSWKSGISVI